jgi:uncharacterized protein
MEGFFLRLANVSYIHQGRKRSRRNNQLTTNVAILGFIFLLLILWISIKVSYQLTHPMRIVAELTDQQKKDFPTLSEISFPDSQNQITLQGWFFSAPTPDHVIILSHGYGSNRLLFQEHTLTFIKEALSRDYNVLTFDYRASGMSEGNVTTLGNAEKHDLLGAISYAKSKDAQHIAVLGLSMGAATAILSTAENPGIVDAVIADSPFHDLKSYLYRNLSHWSNLPNIPFRFFILPISSLMTRTDAGSVQPAKALEKIPAEKIMLIHSQRDTVIPYSESEKLLKASNFDALYWMIVDEQGPNHGKIFENYTSEYMDRVFSFVDSRIASAKTQRYLGMPEDKKIPQMVEEKDETSRAPSAEIPSAVNLNTSPSNLNPTEENAPQTTRPIPTPSKSNSPTTTTEPAIESKPTQLDVPKTQPDSSEEATPSAIQTSKVPSPEENGPTFTDNQEENEPNSQSFAPPSDTNPTSQEIIKPILNEDDTQTETEEKP